MTLTRTEANCPDCAVLPGQPHRTGCDVERCTVCRGQRLQCATDREDDACVAHDPLQALWTGEWPGAAECRARGWYSRPNPAGGGLVPCAASDQGATPDLNRWVTFAMTGKDPAARETAMGSGTDDAPRPTARAGR
jgi:hypothetical protein